MRMPSEPMPGLLDREGERAALDGLLGDLRLGRGGALGVRGEAGGGKAAQVLAFAARRLLAEPVGLIFAARESGEQFRGLAGLEVRGLPDQDARALLDSVVGVRLDEQVRDRIVAETNGNPLALLELPRG